MDVLNSFVADSFCGIFFKMWKISFDSSSVFVVFFKVGLVRYIYSVVEFLGSCE